MTEHVATRSKVQGISSLSSFDGLLNSCTLSEDEKTFMRLHYIEKKDLCFIGDELGYSESTMKKWHRKILKKINALI